MTGATVLIVDDERAIIEAFQSYLEDEYRVRVANDGKAALAKLDADVDVVLLDRRMPDITGDEVLERIESEGYGCEVAMVTAMEPDLDIIDMGFDDYVTKPVSKSGLRKTVEGLLKRREYSEKLREFFTVARKHAALHQENPKGYLNESEEFHDLQARLDQLREEVDDAVADLDQRERLTVAID